MEMTTPVFTRKAKSEGEKMDMTTPVITRRVKLSFLYGLSYIVDALSVFSTMRSIPII